MSKIKYVDEGGEHTGTLTLGEYVHYGINDRFPVDYPVDMVWDNTEYDIFKRAVDSKYKTKVEEAWLV